MTNRHFKAYLIVLGSTVSLYFIVAISTNWLIDPFNELGRNRIGLFFSTQRQAIQSIIKMDHNALLLGSSRIQEIPASELKHYQFANLAFPDAKAEEEYFLLKKYLRNEKLVIIGLDFYIFNDRQFPVLKMNDWSDHLFGRLEYLTSFNVFKSSIIALYKWHMKQSPSMTKDEWEDNELYSTVQMSKKAVLGFNQSTESGSISGEAKEACDTQGDPILDEYYNQHSRDLYGVLENNHYRRFHFSNERMEYLKKIKQLLESHGTRYIVFFNPESDATHFLTKKTGNEELFFHWKELVRKIFPNVKDFSCSGYSAKENYFPGDGFHYQPEVGVKIINSLLDNEE